MHFGRSPDCAFLELAGLCISDVTGWFFVWRCAFLELSGLSILGGPWLSPFLEVSGLCIFEVSGSCIFLLSPDCPFVEVLGLHFRRSPDCESLELAGLCIFEATGLGMLGVLGWGAVRAGAMGWRRRRPGQGRARGHVGAVAGSRFPQF